MLDKLQQVLDDFILQSEVIELHLQSVERLFGISGALREGVLTPEEAYAYQTVLAKLQTDEDKKGRNVTASGCLILLCALFEDLFRRVTVETLRETRLRAETFGRLNSSIRHHHIKALVKVLSDVKEKDIEGGDLITAASELHLCLSGDKSFSLREDQILYQSGNLRSDVVTDILKRIGLRDVWPKISEKIHMREHFGQDNVGLVQHLTISKLNDFMKARNEVTHGADFKSAWGVEKIVEHAAFFKALGRSLVLTLDEFCEEQMPRGKAGPAVLDQLVARA